MVITLIMGASLAAADSERGLRNYYAVMNGQKTLEHLTPEEMLEVIQVHQAIESVTRSNTHGKREYVIEYVHNDELLIINGEKFEAKTYCFGWYEGDKVIFLEGSPSGVCTSAELLNVTRDKRCRVWCE